MGKVNVLLKRSYVCTISVITVSLFYLLTIFFPLLTKSTDVHIFKGIYSLYGVSVIPLLFAIIGGFGVWKEKKWALIVFAVGMILGCLFFIVLEISLPFAYQQVLLSAFSFHCCGLTSLGDWENNIPESCQCDIDSSDECVSACLFLVLL
uniref:Uncharacterized protein n=1 Tax=Xiphophorus couchianus TaxID=32473 RepID=A0A3B5MFD4_9TELE